MPNEQARSAYRVLLASKGVISITDAELDRFIRERRRKLVLYGALVLLLFAGGFYFLGRAVGLIQ
jgi:hypothetical protein